MRLSELDQVTFHNSFADTLRGETPPNRQPRQVPGYHFSRVTPTPVRAPRLLAWADDLAADLGLARPADGSAALDILAGNRVTESMQPFAARYGGHQFGAWAGQLGDGRAITLGEVRAPDDIFWEIQLKGAGPTPYSRRADGRAVLRSSVREFLCSEAMHHLGVPTTRALSLVATGETVVRDMFYDGRPEAEPGAVVARVAPSFVRFGNFQICTATGEIDNLRALTDYVIRRFYPELGAPGPDVYAAWFAEVCRRTAVMIAHWQTVGFVHGVMNTDNMSILGLTIDYGPYGWLEPYEPGWTPNTTDFASRRYGFGQQPRVALWNLAQLAGALAPLVPTTEPLQRGLDAYLETFRATYRARLLAKLGLTATPAEAAERALLTGLEETLVAAALDMTIFFRRLAHAVPALLAGEGAVETIGLELLTEASYQPVPGPGQAALTAWLTQYRDHLRAATAPAEAIRDRMLAVNPKYVLRNYLAQQAIDAATAGDLSVLQRLLAVLRTPFAEQPAHDALAARRPDWAATRPGCATLSCSS